MKVKVQKLKRVDRQAYDKAALRMSKFARKHNTFDMALSLRIKEQSLLDKMVERLRQIGWRTGKITASASVLVNKKLEDIKTMQPIGNFGAFRLSWRPAMAFVMVLAMLAQVSGMTMLKTFAYFTSKAQTENQVFGAGILDISVSPTVFSGGTLVAGNSTSSNFILSNIGNLPLQYTIRTIITSADPALCNGLSVTAANGSNTYSASLKDMASPAANLATSTAATWSFTVSLPSDSTADLQNKSCAFKWVFDAWQQNLSDNTQGFTDSAEIVGTIGSGKWIYDPVKPGDIIINEIMWMGSEDNNGSQSTRDEWIELRNTTDHTLVVDNWNIYGAVSGASGHLEIPNGYEIPAHSYFLISNKDNNNSAINVTVQLRDSSINFDNEYDQNGQLILTNKDTGIVYDKTPIPTGTQWPKGINLNGKRWSMERNLEPGDGTIIDSWHTCDSDNMSSADLATMRSYWDSTANQYNCGTPGNANLSKNDPTAPDYDPTLVSNDGLLDSIAGFAGTGFTQQPEFGLQEIITGDLSAEQDDSTESDLAKEDVVVPEEKTNDLEQPDESAREESVTEETIIEESDTPAADAVKPDTIITEDVPVEETVTTDVKSTEPPPAVEPAVETSGSGEGGSGDE